MRKEKRKERAIKLHRTWVKFKNGDHAGISAMPVDEKLTHYHVLIKGPEDSPFTGGVFRVCLQFDKEYPFEPHQTHVFFLTPIYHPAAYWEEYESLHDSDSREICYPSILNAAGLSLNAILQSIRNDFLRKPNTFLHKPANKYALEDMFRPSRNRREELKLDESIEISSSFVEKRINDLPALAALIGDTEQIGSSLFLDLIQDGAFDQVHSWLRREEDKIEDYARRIEAPYPNSISDAFKKILDHCKELTLFEKARRHFVNRFLMDYFKLLFYQSEWWMKAAEASRTFASLGEQDLVGTFDQWSCPLS